MKGSLAAVMFAAACAFSSHTAAVSLIDFSSGTWDLPSAAGDFYHQEGFTVQSPNGAVDPASIGLQQWEWQNFCQAACGPTIFNPTTVSFMQGAEFFDFVSFTIISNLGGIRVNADGGLQATFMANDVGLKKLNWNNVSVLVFTNLLGPTIGARRDAAIDSIRVSPIPEPTTAMLFVLGALGLLAAKPKTRKR